MPLVQHLSAVETAAHLCDHVYPRLPVRQWVLSVPKRLRYFMQRDGAVLGMVLRIFLRVIAQSLQAHSPGAAQVDKAALHWSGCCATALLRQTTLCHGSSSQRRC